MRIFRFAELTEADFRRISVIMLGELRNTSRQSKR